VTEEAEKLAKWEMVEQYQKAKAHLAALENEMNKLGKSLHEFARVLTGPVGIAMEVGADYILGVNLHSKTQLFRLSNKDLTWELIAGLVSDYGKTYAERNRLQGQLKNIGVDVQ
jgi:hypothetical protein